MNNEKHEDVKPVTKHDSLPANDLTGQDVLNTGKDVVKTAVVWTLAGMLSQAMVKGLKGILGK